jgi:hypothetical protein
MSDRYALDDVSFRLRFKGILIRAAMNIGEPWPETDTPVKEIREFCRFDGIDVAASSFANAKISTDGKARKGLLVDVATFAGKVYCFFVEMTLDELILVTFLHPEQVDANG